MRAKTITVESAEKRGEAQRGIIFSATSALLCDFSGFSSFGGRR